MANHQSALKRIRQNAVRKARNKYYHKTTRNAIRTVLGTEGKADQAEIKNVIGMVDKLAKRNIIHKNKASRLKSSLMRRANA